MCKPSTSCATPTSLCPSGEAARLLRVTANPVAAGCCHVLHCCGWRLQCCWSAAFDLVRRHPHREFEIAT
jgi:hypothetical protein